MALLQLLYQGLWWSILKVWSDPAVELGLIVPLSAIEVTLSPSTHQSVQNSEVWRKNENIFVRDI